MGVDVSKLKVEIQRAIPTAVRLYKLHTGENVVITSTYEKAKGRLVNSKHYENQAFDTRIRNIPKETVALIVKVANDTLGRDYDIVQKKDHIHWEYDPKV